MTLTLSGATFGAQTPLWAFDLYYNLILVDQDSSGSTKWNNNADFITKLVGYTPTQTQSTNINTGSGSGGTTVASG